VRWLLGIVVWLVVVGGGLAALSRHDAGIEWVPGIRFAGVDSIYALRRVAGASDYILMLDEVQARGTLGDMRFRRIDTDLRTGPIDEVMRQLQRAAGDSFDFETGDGWIYVRSNLPIHVKTDLDAVLIPEAEFAGNFADLLAAIKKHEPRVFLRAAYGGGKDLPEVSMHIEAGTSVIGALRRYGQESGIGWHLTRAGYVVERGSSQISILPSSIRAWARMTKPRHLPFNRNLPSLAQALGSIVKRTGFPVCVFDRTPLGINRGALDFEPFVDPQQPPEQSLDTLARTEIYHFYDWEKVGDIGVVRSTHFQEYPIKTGFVSRKLRGGSFSGTLGDFARFLTRNLEEPAVEVIMAGEILPNDPVTQVEIPAGSTIEQALVEWAKASGTCWYWVSLDRLDPIQTPIPQALPEHSFVGAFVSPTAYWAEAPGF
jgi:hypothetical protein